MQSALKLTTKVLPGSRVEFVAPGLPEGADVDVLVTLSGTPDQDALRQRFDMLAGQWKRETAALSSPSQMAMHPAYQEIIGIGRDAVPLILQELCQQPGHWFWALRAITGEDPIKPEQRGRVSEMATAWLDWGRKHGYAV